MNFPTHPVTVARLRELAGHVEEMQHLRLVLVDAPPVEGAVVSTIAGGPEHFDAFNMSRYAVDTECGTVGCLAGLACGKWAEDADSSWWGFASGMRALRLDTQNKEQCEWAQALFAPPMGDIELERLKPTTAARACRRLAGLLHAIGQSGRPWQCHTDAETLADALWGPEEILYHDERSPV